MSLVEIMPPLVKHCVILGSDHIILSCGAGFIFIQIFGKGFSWNSILLSEFHVIYANIIECEIIFFGFMYSEKNYFGLQFI